MALIRKSLTGILSAFTKPLADLDAFIAQEQKQITIYDNNISKLEQLIDDQDGKRIQSVQDIAQAKAFGDRLKALVDGPVVVEDLPPPAALNRGKKPVY